MTPRWEKYSKLSTRLYFWDYICLFKQILTEWCATMFSLIFLQWVKTVNLQHLSSIKRNPKNGRHCLTVNEWWFRHFIPHRNVFRLKFLVEIPRAPSWFQYDNSSSSLSSPWQTLSKEQTFQIFIILALLVLLSIKTVEKKQCHLLKNTILIWKHHIFTSMYSFKHFSESKFGPPCTIIQFAKIQVN